MWYYHELSCVFVIIVVVITINRLGYKQKFSKKQKKKLEILPIY